MSAGLTGLLTAARGDSEADLVFKNARIINVFDGSVEKGDVAIFDGRIAGIGSYSKAKKTIDLKGKYLSPGFINGHTHLESSMLDISEYARAVAPHGTTSVVTDLHEIANVCGMKGIEYVLKSMKRMPLDLYLMAPSCVPATHLETAGAVIGPDEISRLLKLKNCQGLGEMMNYPGVVFGDPAVLKKIELASGKVIDGHAPSVSGPNLNTYIAAGIMSDHECVTLEEAREKLKLGMQILIREGSSEKNLEALLPVVDDNTFRRCCFVVDDRSCSDLLRDGDIDAVVRKAIKLGLDPVRAIQLATINTAQYFRIKNTGAVAPGYRANLVVLSNLETLAVESVYYEGKLIAEKGKALFNSIKVEDAELSRSVNIKTFNEKSLKLKAWKNEFPVIEIVPGQIITRMKLMELKTENGYIVPDLDRDILKLAVVERHLSSGRVGLGMVTGLGIKSGAIASTVGHDSHNLIVAGTSDEDMLTAVKAVQSMQGGLVAVSKGKVIASLALPVAGLLAPLPLEEVVSRFETLEKAVREMGSKLSAPFAALSFLALPVIPEIRLTDLGLVDVNAFKLIEPG